MANRISLLVLENAEMVARKAARMIADVVRTKPSSVIGLATGSTPEQTYAELSNLHAAGDVSFAGARTFNLDEYYRLPGDHPQSYRAFMQQHLFSRIDIAPWNTHVLNGMTTSAVDECEAFEKKIRSVGGVDLWLLGIGVNGHIAFNEPGSAVNSRTRLVALTESTIAANSDGRFFSNPEDVPRCALTAGIATIREARQIVVLATGIKKADAVAAALNGPFTEACPASLLQDHPDCCFIVDQEAASKIK